MYMVIPFIRNPVSSQRNTRSLLSPISVTNGTYARFFMSCGIRQLRLQPEQHIKFSCAASKNNSKDQVKMPLSTPHRKCGSTPLYLLAFVGIKTNMHLESIRCSSLSKTSCAKTFAVFA